MELIGGMGHVEFVLIYFEIVLAVGARLLLYLSQTYHRLINHFRCNRWYS
jgi:hypothetical protein